MRLPALDCILARQLESGLDRLRSTGHEIHAVESGRCRLDQDISQLLQRLIGKEACVCIGNLVQLPFDGRDHGRVAVAQAGHRGASRRIEVSPAVAIDDVDAVPFHGYRQIAACVTVKDMLHGLARVWVGQ